jgi:tetratricopeptide (TPR) repeat protein
VDEVDEETSVPQLEVAVMGDEETEAPSYERIEAALTEADEVETPDKPFLIQKESGPLYPDLLVQFNTSELHLPLGSPRPVVGPPQAEQRVGTGDLIGALVSGIDSSFDYIHQPVEEPAVENQSSTDDPAEYDFPPDEQETVAPPMAADHVETVPVLMEVETVPESMEVETAPASMEDRSARDELQEIFEELKEKTSDLKPLIDFETHYSLGLAYKDMDLLDDAISEFQMAFRTAGAVDLAGDCIHCCNMLGVCFKRKQIPTVAIMWFERGLKIPDRLEDEYQALRFEIGICYEEMGQLDKAIEAFTQVYGIDVNYRKVAAKIKELRAATA